MSDNYTNDKKPNKKQNQPQKEKNRSQASHQKSLHQSDNNHLNFYGGKELNDYFIDATNKSFKVVSIFDYGLINNLYIYVNKQLAEDLTFYGLHCDTKNNCYFYSMKYKNIYIKTYSPFYPESVVSNIFILKNKDIKIHQPTVNYNGRQFAVAESWKYQHENKAYIKNTTKTFHDLKRLKLIKEIKNLDIKKMKKNIENQKHTPLRSYKDQYVRSTQNKIYELDDFFGIARMSRDTSGIIFSTENHDNNNGFVGYEFHVKGGNKIFLISDSKAGVYYNYTAKNKDIYSSFSHTDDKKKLVASDNADSMKYKGSLSRVSFDAFINNLRILQVIDNKKQSLQPPNPVFVSGVSKKTDILFVLSNGAFKANVNIKPKKSKLIFNFLPEATQPGTELPIMRSFKNDIITGDPRFDRAQKFVATIFYGNPNNIQFGLKENDSSWEYKKTFLMDREEFLNDFSLRYVKKDILCSAVSRMRSTLGSVVIIEPFPVHLNSSNLRINIPPLTHK